MCEGFPVIFDGMISIKQTHHYLEALGIGVSRTEILGGVNDPREARRAEH